MNLNFAFFDKQASAALIALSIVLAPATWAQQSDGELPIAVYEPDFLARMGLLEAGVAHVLPEAFEAPSLAEQQELLESRVKTPSASSVFGTGNGFSTVGAPDFAAVRSDTDLSIGSNGRRLHCESSSGTFSNFADARIDVPNGVGLQYVDIWGNRTSTQHMEFFLTEDCLPALSRGFQSSRTIATLNSNSTIFDADGNYILTSSLSDRTADSHSCWYNLRMRFGDVGNGCSEGSSLSVYKARIEWQRRVSPAPGVATYNDVPTTDPDFQFIEALGTTGVVQGCLAGKFCPDEVVTHRLMARYLARLLGLDWSGF
ncbi:MAG: hypothetical protein IH953_07325 [Chloroflexi bacterium]|nr:hypothetical protein [Chloroflexota bacterium]